MAILLIAISGGVCACGGGGSGGDSGGGGLSGTTAGAYTVTVTGTSGSIVAAGAVKLTVQ
jgi:trimeric autotransporter adhesin